MSVRRTRTTVTVSSDRGVFMISVAAELAEMHPQTLRMYEQRGLIEPKRSPKGTRLYSHEDVERLRRIQAMTNELGLNLAGVEHVLRLEQELERARRRVEALERRTADLQADMAEQLEAVRRELRGGELVPLKHTRDIVPRYRMPAADAEAEPEPELGEPERPATAVEPPAGPPPAGPRRIPVRRDGDQPSR
jgi:MerR family transcriptional regulator/heat shock protein HspR